MAAKTELGRFPTADRVIFLVFLILISTPLVVLIGLPIPISESTRKSYELMNSLKSGDVLVMCFEMDVGAFPALGPGDMAALKHAFTMVKEKGIKVIIFGTYESGVKIYIDKILQETKEYWESLNYGVDWVNFGWIPGHETAMATFARDVHTACSVDVYGTPVDELPIMKDIKTINDVTGIWYTTYSSPDMLPRQWSPLEWPGLKWTICSTLFGTVSWLMPYVNAGSITSYVADQRGGAEYEVLIGKRGLGCKFMDAQSLGHIYGIALIIGSNVYYLYTHAKKPKRKEE